MTQSKESTSGDSKPTFSGPVTLIDTHVHAYPNWVGDFLPSSSSWIAPYKSTLRTMVFSPLSRIFHASQAVTRLLPEAARRPIEEVASLIPLANMLTESSVEDLLERMDESQASSCLLIAHPPLIPNEFVLQCANDHPGRIFAVVSLPKPVARFPKAPSPERQLEAWVKKGARALKIHMASEGGSPRDPYYTALLKSAEALDLPVILHTGCFQSHLFFKAPEHGAVETFEPWFEKFPKIRFILAHINGPEPMKAIQLAQKYPNLFLEISWQPSEIIGEAVRSIGASRVLFGSDWPFMGDNLSITLEKVKACVKKDDFSEKELDLILTHNAKELFKLCPPLTNN